MWMFYAGGLIMPAAIPEHAEIDEYTIQVRARKISHLENFINDFMTDLDHSEIVRLYHTDYEYRFYTTQEALATAMARCAASIDYTKFKPQALDYEGGAGHNNERYHDQLEDVWGVMYPL